MYAAANAKLNAIDEMFSRLEHPEYDHGGGVTLLARVQGAPNRPLNSKPKEDLKVQL